MQFDVWNATQPLRTFFYIVSRNESTFDKAEDVPDYITEAIPLFIALLTLEQIILWVQGKETLRVNDAIGSISSGLLLEIHKITVVSFEVVAYIWFYSKFNLVQLPWDSLWTWWGCLIAVDFGYYWLHRLSHEVNVMWAAHQVHHSSEDYNLSTALRQSMFQQYFGGIVYLPLALFIPPSVFLVHLQFNTLFQFWIHTSIVGNLGVVDLIINSPSNHRVHHGRNRYCIDKNYAAVFMIWDHLFGTYEAESDEVVYGLVHPLNSFNPIYVQFCHFSYIWNIFWEAKGIKNKLEVLFKGPGWGPGKPRLGLIEDIPDISAPQVKYDPPLSCFCKLYLFAHFIAIILTYQEYALNHTNVSHVTTILFTFYLVFSLVSFGAVLDRKSYAPLLEFSRCIACIVLFDFLIVPILGPRLLSTFVSILIRGLFLLSSVLWLQACKDALAIMWKTKQS